MRTIYKTTILNVRFGKLFDLRHGHFVVYYKKFLIKYLIQKIGFLVVKKQLIKCSLYENIYYNLAKYETLNMLNIRHGVKWFFKYIV